MNKSQLKAKWGHYVDTDKMVDNIITLLTTYNHSNSEHGVCTMLDTFFTNKESLIKKFISSPNYIGDLRIGLRREFARDNNARDISDFCDRFGSKVGARDIIYTHTDEHGKKMEDYIFTGVKSVCAKNLHSASFRRQLQDSRVGMKKFTENGYTIKSINDAQDFHNIIRGTFSHITRSSLNDRDISDICSHNSSLRLAKGLKTSRAFNRVCEAYGITKASNYNKLFAQYADLVSDFKRELDVYISLNPYDYLTMSFGNSWASCHTIDKQNVRDMPSFYSGGYCGGTLSYMLDGVSIITFAVDKNGDVQNDGKIYRNMFHFGNNMLVQSRVYPQSNDGGTDLYATFRDIVQEEFALMLGLTNKWCHLGYRQECVNRITSHGVHYPDYRNISDCNISCPEELLTTINDDSGISVGHIGVCAYCGKPIDVSNRVSHDACHIEASYTVHWAF